MLNGETFAEQMHSLLPAPPDSMAVAVSGGADSMALCLLTHEWAQQRNISSHAITVDHQLRPESTTEARQVGTWLGARGIPHHVLTWHDAKPSANVQAHARHARYRLMTDWCRNAGIAHILLAHHLDDQAETFLIRLGRGSGVDGLAAMQPCVERHGMTLLRPLLDVPKTQLLNYLATQQQDWIDDPSNHNPEFTRVRMRNLAPALSGAGIHPTTLAATAHHMARTRDYLEQQTHAAYTHCLNEHAHGFMQLNMAAFTALHPEIALRVLATVLCRMNNTHLKPRFHELEALYHALNHARTLNGCQFTPKGDTVIITREAAAIAAAVPIAAGQSLNWDGRFTITLHNDCPLQHATIGALGEDGFLTIKADSTTAQRMGRNAAQLLPALWHLEKPVLVPHIDYTAHDAEPHWMTATAFQKQVNAC